MAKKKLDKPLPEQELAWQYYGTPAKGGVGKAAGITSRVGEVRYIIGWMADQMVRMGWRVVIDGSESWTVQHGEGDKIVSDNSVTDSEEPNHPANASRKLLELIEWNSRTVREVTTNLFVAGEMHYAQDGDRWRVVSVVRPDRDEIVGKSLLTVHGLWPHPADPTKPDAPLFGVLDVLNDMVWLNRLSRSQSANRVGMRGIIGVSDQFKNAEGETGQGFWADLEASLSRPMDDPEDVSPVGLVGAQDLVEPKDRGMKGLSWVIPDFPYDDKVDERMAALVRRLAYGLPVPPEILLGLQAQSKATAFQVEGSTYRAHIEPVASLVSQIATDTLEKLLDLSNKSVEVVPDPTVILARRHSVADVTEAFDRGAVGFKYYREVLGIPERAAVTDEDIRIRREIAHRVANNRGVDNPAEDAASEPISAAATVPGGDLETAEPSPASEDDKWLEDRLYQIDQAAFYELVGASQQAVSRAREKLGARIRSNKNMKQSIPTELTNEEVALKLGQSNFEDLGIDSTSIIKSAIEPTLKWWEKRANRARKEVAETLSIGDVEVEFSPKSLALSITRLEETLVQGVFGADGVGEAPLRKVLEEAGA